MPNETTEQPKTVIVLTPEQKEAISGAKASRGKKVLYWVLAVLVILLISAVVVAVILATRGKSNLAKPIIDKTRHELHKADMDAKIKAAEAAGAEKAALDELERIKKIEDEHERNKRLAEIL